MVSPGTDVGIHLVGCLPQGQLTQGEEDAGIGERIGGGSRDARGPRAGGDLARRDIHDLYLVGPLEDRVGHRVHHPHAGDLLDDVVEAFEPEGVERRQHGNALVEQLDEILPSTGVPAARGVGALDVVEQECPRAARERGIEIEAGP